MLRNLHSKIVQWNFDKKMRWYIAGIICLSSVLIFVVITGAYLMFSIQQSKKMAEEQLSSLAANYESTLDTYKAQALALMLDNSIQEYLKGGGPDSPGYYERTDSAQESLMNFTNMNASMNFVSVVSYQFPGYLYKGKATQINTRFSSSYEQDYDGSIKGPGKGTLRMSYNDAYTRDGSCSLNVYQPIYSLTYLNKEMGLFCMNYEDNFLKNLSEKKYFDFESEIYMIDKAGRLFSAYGEQSQAPFPWMDLLVKEKGSFTRDNTIYNYQKIGSWNFYIINQTPMFEFYKSCVRIIPILAIIILLLSACSIYVGNCLIHRMYRPVDLLVKEMEQVANGRLEVRSSPDYAGNDFRQLIDGFNYMMDEINSLIRKVRAEQHQKEQIRFNALQSQIQPHFLYNTLECIHWQAMVEGAEDISIMVKALAQYYRSCLSKGKDVITLAEELEQIRNYLIIQNMRYDNMIAYQDEVTEEFRHVPIPKLTLQPLVENAIYHGIRNRENARGSIRVSAVNREDAVIVQVEDDGVGMPLRQMEQINRTIGEFDEGLGYGLQNVNKRIELLFGEEYGLCYRSNDAGGVTVEIRLPGQ